MDTENKNNLKLPSKEENFKIRKSKKPRGLLLRDTVRTPEEVDKLSKYDVDCFRLSGSYKEKVKYLMRDMSFIEAKRKIIRDFVIKKQFDLSSKRPHSPGGSLPDISSATPVKIPRLEEPNKYLEKPLSEVHPAKEKPTSEVVTQDDISDEKPRTEDITGGEKPEEISRPEEIQIDKSDDAPKSEGDKHEKKTKTEEIQEDKFKEKDKSEVINHADKKPSSEVITQADKPVLKLIPEVITQADRSVEKHDSEVINHADKCDEKPSSEVVTQADKPDENLIPEVINQADRSEEKHGLGVINHADKCDEKPSSEVVTQADKPDENLIPEVINQANKSNDQPRSEGITKDGKPDKESRAEVIQVDKSEEKHQSEVIDHADKSEESSSSFYVETNMTSQNENNFKLPAKKLIFKLETTKRQKGLKLRESVRTLEDVDKLTNNKVNMFCLPSSCRKRFKSLRKDMRSIEAKKKIIRDYLIRKKLSSPRETHQLSDRNFPDTPLGESIKSVEKPTSEVVSHADKKPSSEVVTQADKPDENLIPEVINQANKSNDQPRSEGITKDDKPDKESRAEVIQVDKSEEKHQSEVIDHADKSEESSSSFYVETSKTSQNENNFKLPAHKLILKLEITKRQKGLKLRENVRTLEDVDKLTNKEVCMFSLPSSCRKRWWKSLRKDVRTIEAKKNIIRDYVIRKQPSSPRETHQLSSRNIPVTPLGESIKSVEKPTSEVVSHADKSECIALEDKQSKTEDIQSAQAAKLEEIPNSLQTDTSENRTGRRPRTRHKKKKKLNSAACTSTSSPEESVKKQLSEQQEELNNSSESEKVLIVLEGFPEVQLDCEKHDLILQEILEVYENIPMCSGTCVAFDKWISTPEYLIIPCRDKYSAQWLKDIIPTLRPWENCFLKVISADQLPNPYVCTVAVSEEFGVQLSAKQILARLSVGNAGLNTDQWSVLKSSTVGQKQIWTFSMDSASLMRLKELEMRPRCGFKRLRFRYKSTFWSGSQNVSADSSSGVQDTDLSN